MSFAPLDWARDRRKESRTSRRSMAMNSWDFRVLPKSAAMLEGEKILTRFTWRSMRLRGMLNSSSMQSGMAPPHGLAVVGGLRSRRKVSMPPVARASAAEEPAGPPPITAARSFRPESEAAILMEWEWVLWCGIDFMVMDEGKNVEWRWWI